MNAFLQWFLSILKISVLFWIQDLLKLLSGNYQLTAYWTIMTPTIMIFILCTHADTVLLALFASSGFRSAFCLGHFCVVYRFSPCLHMFICFFCFFPQIRCECDERLFYNRSLICPECILSFAHRWLGWAPWTYRATIWIWNSFGSSICDWHINIIKFIRCIKQVPLVTTMEMSTKDAFHKYLLHKDTKVTWNWLHLIRLYI